MELKMDTSDVFGPCTFFLLEKLHKLRFDEDIYKKMIHDVKYRLDNFRDSLNEIQITNIELFLIFNVYYISGHHCDCQGLSVPFIN